ncbi:hypothetical protein [Lachnotalea glycerini]|uniref:Uncharacterized protein n=1 Tax=Lachnotalea glycerini TaxID=1763509 RepID=A0A371JHJ9_9FIRM|nr:hypothetical protein [Lachnotalea glycerini]RDY32221.1 hypothetical protein CG710_005950 [Lachnotalea glycerini]
MGNGIVNYALAQPYASPNTFFNMNNQFDLFGKTVILVGTTSTSYPRIMDEPMIAEPKPKVTKESLWGKIAVGLAVVACVACVAAYAASVAFTGGATAAFAPYIVGGMAACVGTYAVMNQANEDIENQEESSYWTYMWEGAKGAYTGAEIGFAVVSVLEIGAGIWQCLKGGGGKLGTLAAKSKSTVSREVSLEGESQADILANNRMQGRLFEQQEFAKFSSQSSNAVEQVTVKTSSGVKTRVDAIGLDSNGNVLINEFKSSVTAPLTNNQKIAFPEIMESGGTVVGKGKGIFTGGYQIPSGTEVKIIRP